jgi:hypothetical protein
MLEKSLVNKWDKCMNADLKDYKKIQNLHLVENPSMNLGKGDLSLKDANLIKC